METKEALVIQVNKDFPVSVDRLYNAWVSPEELKQWWHPMGNRLREVQNDLKEGGTVTYIFEKENGEHAFTISGQYSEVRERERLVYSWNWNIPNESVKNSDFLLTISFKSEGNGSRLEVKQENIQDEEMLQPHQEGWDKALNDLHSYLSNNQ